MFEYHQKTGAIYKGGAGVALGLGYSGHGEGKNNPLMEAAHNVGPIPCGRYDIGAPRDTETHGPYVMPLTPHPDNQMFGRAGFLIHGDSKTAPGTASQGCIILPPGLRHLIGTSGDHDLTVVP